ncbi:MAG: winged helix-turn-helix domain-containing protein [Thermoproteota archaeon]|jgi:DNA-binding transcriptional ArsR family regulator|nr:winged helix-turn-helix domain-containing protein [Thermoproteota archaeon]NLD66643.1 winged helix-turn-helix transcriptional regulator [Thermoproteota archaeon]
MTSTIDSLHKILKDETRRKIILELNQKGSVGYTDLMESLGITSTGTLNYHLKVLGDLLEKDQTEKYRLSEKGKLALKLLTEFPQNNQIERKKWQKRLFIILTASQILYLTIIVTLYLLSIVDFYRVILAISYFVMATVVLYIGYRMQRTIPISGSKEEKARMRIGYTLGGIFLGLVTFFFAAGFIMRALQEITKQPLLQTIFWTDWYLGFSLVIAPMMGGVAGYCLGKKKGFQKPKWAVWLDRYL